ncbi:hypothetical protein PU629_09460 [Pullulanibacillus sp. KACC 23026]|uniref:hypothetical protein n=1 Tax=Pullulanibacillus sp. KACC 23026 TaxID=3028315 RepID=UPI0023B0FD54|nr:hypothetical protein [Pullulanibacillus sp. KACC 23026]WEG14561.1 hypothetical protein PU629_09460 [Pullulanibacillus sp. KACC 23026]
MHHCWPIFPFLFFLIIAGFILSNRIMWRRSGRRNYRGYRPDDRSQALMILAKRLATGEIDVNEYKTLKDVLEEKQ